MQLSKQTIRRSSAGLRPIANFLLNSHISCQSGFNTLERKKNKPTKTNPVSCHHFDTDASFVSRVNMRGNLITAPAEFDVTFDFAIYLCSQKYNRKVERIKTLPKCFSRMVTFYILGSKFKLFTVANFVAAWQNILFSIYTS